MRKVNVKKVHTATLKLLAKNPAVVFRGGEEPQRHFIRQFKRIPGVSGNQAFADRDFAHMVVIHVGRVKITAALFHKNIRHGLDGFQIDLPVVVGVCQRQTHEPESEFQHEVSPCL